jgi:DNA-binding beta-propeller fold protein YncE
VLVTGFLFASGCRDEGNVVTVEDEDLLLDPWFPSAPAEALASPLRLTITKRGRLVVSDSEHGTVLLVDPVSLQPEQALEIQGKPMGVALLGKRLFVGNATTRTIEVYHAQGGELMRSFGANAVEYPSDLAVDDVLGLVFAVDGATREVKVFDVRGAPRGTISGPGATPDRLRSPTAVAVDPVRGEVYISDYGDDGGYASVKIFDYAGNFIDEISGAGSCGMLGCNGGFSRPQGLVVDGQGKIYFADAVLAQVLVYDRATLERVEALGSRAAGIRLPLDVAVGEAGEVYVTSNRTRSVEMLTSGGSP